MSRSVIFLAGALVLLAGCASKVERGGSPAGGIGDPAPVPGFGRLTLIRIEPEPAAPEVLIHIGGELAGVLGNESFLTFVLPRGSNTLVLDWEDSPLKFEEVILIEPEYRPEKFLSLVRKFDLPEISKGAGSTEYTMVETLGLLELPPAIGTNVIRNLDPDFSWVDERYIRMPN
ncbi:hypothetical protein [Pontiella sp.]|uniref:hypothetical protein n=1 Tax=Pontiella sp. TaxID=2837462 RepID=UPI0035690E24